ncbi:MAG: ABC transporter permease [Gemmatimonas sp.]|nr:ABC transporter permease [Gemmatimonas sp.]
MSVEEQGQSPDPSAEAGTGRFSAWMPSGGTTLVILERFGLLLLLFAIIVAFSVALPDSFPTDQTLTAIVSSQPAAIFAAFAVLVPLIAGEFDLSVGFGLGFTSVFFAWLMGNEITFALALLIVVVIGLMIGAVNGWLVVHLGMNSFIATLGSGTILSGLILYFTNGQILSENLPQGLLDATRTEVVGIVLPVFYVVAVGLFMWYVLEHTPLGRRMYATGAGVEAARLTGINTQRLRFFSFVAGSMLWVIAGLINTGRIGAAYPDIGPSFLLPAFAACFLGATAIKPRYFNVWGTVAASILVVVGVTGFQQAGVKEWIEPVFTGMVLLLAVAISVRTSVLRARLHD